MCDFENSPFFGYKDLLMKFDVNVNLKEELINYYLSIKIAEKFNRLTAFGNILKCIVK